MQTMMESSLRMIGLFACTDSDYRAYCKTRLLPEDPIFFVKGKLYRFCLSMSLFRMRKQTFFIERRPIYVSD